MDGLAGSGGRFLVLAAEKTPNRNREEGRAAERIERAQPQAALGPFECALGFSAKRQNDAALDVGDGRGWADGKRCLECCEGGGTIVLVHPDDKSGERQRKRIVLTMRYGSFGMADRGQPVLLVQPTAQEE